MNPEISSTLIHDRQADVNTSAAITSDHRKPPQDQRNSRDVVLLTAPAAPDGLARVPSRVPDAPAKQPA